ncbi:MAG: polysaccharide deacetylase [Pseudomonadota bacterium]|nr:polysaccharide deacetylase [Pseudomonadota bacterium]
MALRVAPARADCDASLVAPTSLRAAETVADYKPVLRACHGEGGDRIAIRELRLGGAPALLLADSATLETRLERAACWTCQDVAESALADTRMMRAIDRAAAAPGLTHRSFLNNAGLTHGQSGGFFTGDLCPSYRPMDRAFLQTLQGERTPVALSISGAWLKHHFADYRWLLDAQAKSRLAITWINHSYSHPYRPGVAEGANFLLTARVDADYEILQTERLLIANGQTPSLFFRFPGLVSSSPLMQAVRRHHLIALGADAWLALNQKPHDGSIILVHPNGNEELGLQIYRRDAAKGLLPPLKPLDEAPE